MFPPNNLNICSIWKAFVVQEIKSFRQKRRTETCTNQILSLIRNIVHIVKFRGNISNLLTLTFSHLCRNFWRHSRDLLASLQLISIQIAFGILSIKVFFLALRWSCYHNLTITFDGTCDLTGFKCGCMSCWNVFRDHPGVIVSIPFISMECKKIVCGHN